MGKYEELANDFCEKYGVSVHVAYSHTGRHFEEDTVSRDIYKVTIKRGDKVYTTMFGDSLVNTQKRLERARAGRRGRVPSADDILSCLMIYDPGDFDDFIQQYSSGIKSQRQYVKLQTKYFAVVDEYRALSDMFADCMDELEAIW